MTARLRAYRRLFQVGFSGEVVLFVLTVLGIGGPEWMFNLATAVALVGLLFEKYEERRLTRKAGR